MIIGNAIFLCSTQMQAEVGLLSRSILIQGDLSSEPTDVDQPACADKNFGSYPCPNKFLTGFGGHTMVIGSSAVAYFSGVEAFRMGQTNVLGRYPFHAHLVGETAGRVSFKDSSVHRSFYRCFTLHGTSNAEVSNNVAFDIIGHCYYLEDGIEERNNISFNLAAHIHFLGYPQRADSQDHATFTANASLLNPADATAGGFYISNAYNRVIGNAASGGYSGFAFPRFDTYLRVFRSLVPPIGKEPSSRPTLEFDSNTCHSSGFWWTSAGCIYVGGVLKQDATTGVFTYNAGRDNPTRNTKCADGTGSPSFLNEYYAPCSLTFNNTKVFLSGWGINHWGPRGEFHNSEFHWTNRPFGILGRHWTNNALIDCRPPTHTPELPMPSLPGAQNSWQEVRFHLGAGRYLGIQWYDTFQVKRQAHDCFLAFS